MMRISPADLMAIHAVIQQIADVPADITQVVVGEHKIYLDRIDGAYLVRGIELLASPEQAPAMRNSRR